MKYVKGDLIKAALEGEFDAIVHGCDCFNTMGGGIAAQVRGHFPRAYDRDQLTEKGDSRKLGNCQFVKCIPSIPQLATVIVVNAYTQFDFGGKYVNVDYNAVESCMYQIKLNLFGYRIGMPLIGCGLAGGDWKFCERIIEHVLGDEDVTIMHLEDR